MNNTPQLRFPGFTGEWSEKKLGEVLEYEQPQKYLVSCDNYKTQGTPVLTAGKTFVLGYTDEKDGIYADVPVIIFDDFVTESKYVTFPFKAKSSAMKMLKLIDEQNSLRVIYESMQMLNYPVKEHKRYWISEYSKLPILLPSPAEQQKIAECLSALDDLISAQGEKVDALKTRKKGLMQQLFPQNGETTPRLRFPGFTEEWSEKLVKEVCDINTGKSNTQDQVEDGQYPFYIRSATPVKSNRYLYDCEAVITIGDGQIGKVFHYVNGKFDLHQRCYMMSTFRGVTARFFYHFFATNFYERAMRMTAKATVDSVRLEMIADMPIYLPSPAEQQKIASCLSALDDLIASESAELEALKAHKKGLMQQLFPEPSK